MNQTTSFPRSPHDSGMLVDLSDTDDDHNNNNHTASSSSNHTSYHMHDNPPPPPRPQQQQPDEESYGLSSAISGWFGRTFGASRTNSHLTTSSSYSTTSSPPASLHASQTFPATTATSSSSMMHHSHHHYGIGDGINTAFIPPPPAQHRAVSPLGLPDLDPVVLRGYRADTGPAEQILGDSVAEQIRTCLPDRLKICEDWRLVYSLYQDGSSLSTLYKLCEEYRGRRVGFVLVVRDGVGGTFGAYLTEAPHIAPGYYGNGECFLWRASIHVPLPPPPSADTTDLIDTRSTTISSPTKTTTPNHLSPQLHDVSSSSSGPLARAAQAQHSVRFQVYKYNFDDREIYSILSERDFLSVGGGASGKYGLWLDDGFNRGASGTCETFENPPLSDEGEKFDILGVELWVIGASS